MRRFSCPLLGIIATTIFAAAGAARAEHFEIQLTLSTAAEKTTSSSDTNTPAQEQGFKPRPVCHGKVGEEVVLQFFCASNFPHNAIRNVTIRYYIVPEAKAGQADIPSLDQAVLQGHFTMDFKPDTGKVGLRQRLHIDKPGTYLVRIGSENSDSDHEHFSATDLVIE